MFLTKMLLTLIQRPVWSYNYNDVQFCFQKLLKFKIYKIFLKFDNVINFAKIHNLQKKNFSFWTIFETRREQSLSNCYKKPDLFRHDCAVQCHVHVHLHLYCTCTLTCTEFMK